MVLKIFVVFKNWTPPFPDQIPKNPALDFFVMNGRGTQFFISYYLASFISAVLECIKFAKVFFPEIFF